MTNSATAADPTPRVGGTDRSADRNLPAVVAAGLRKSFGERVAVDGIDFVVELIDEVRQIEGVKGVHVMAVEWEEMVPTIVERAGLFPRP